MERMKASPKHMTRPSRSRPLARHRIGKAVCEKSEQGRFRPPSCKQMGQLAHLVRGRTPPGRRIKNPAHASGTVAGDEPGGEASVLRRVRTVWFGDSYPAGHVSGKEWRGKQDPPPVRRGLFRRRLRSTAAPAHLREGSDNLRRRHRRRSNWLPKDPSACGGVVAARPPLEKCLEGDNLLNRLRLVPRRPPHACTCPLALGYSKSPLTDKVAGERERERERARPTFGFEEPAAVLAGELGDALVSEVSKGLVKRRAGGDLPGAHGGRIRRRHPVVMGQGSGDGLARVSAAEAEITSSSRSLSNQPPRRQARAFGNVTPSLEEYYIVVGTRGGTGIGRGVSASLRVVPFYLITAATPHAATSVRCSHQ
ncbi:hypothetical protein BHM03_00031725 [Ensete ventricosum]|uniref:Uncharacterized protein n=1 Tax=Ensete ventricosum TaxID=4639 RepID=A0A445MIV3_ENSVE|nr:hypothetical protein BHM03_00031725 [Ensete ventricosum]